MAIPEFPMSLPSYSHHNPSESHIFSYIFHRKTLSFPDLTVPCGGHRIFPEVENNASCCVLSFCRHWKGDRPVLAIFNFGGASGESGGCEGKETTGKSPVVEWMVEWWLYDGWFRWLNGGCVMVVNDTVV